MQNVIEGFGSISKLSKLIEDLNAKNILLFSGRNFYSNYQDIIKSQLQNKNVTEILDFEPNPKFLEIDNCVKTYDAQNFDAIIAFGGGSVIDVSKAYRYYSKSPLPLIAIPTTAGTGSEATQFAVVYIDGVKNSLDEPAIRPNHVILDAQFCMNAPQYLKACSAIDAYCQAIESYWAVKSTEESRKYARDAIIEIRDIIVDFVNNTTKENAVKMLHGAHLAGKAINISRTTAAHAFSYTITSKYGIPHGHAVALMLPEIFENNLNASENMCNDPRGYEFVHERLRELTNLLKIESSIASQWHDVMQNLKLEDNLKKLKINNKSSIYSNVNQNRLKNNPFSITLLLEYSNY